jgi:hypothetical protein
MGQFWQGIPEFFLIEIKKSLGDEFIAIETGTYKGHTARKLSRFANHVITIEADCSYYLKSKRTLQSLQNVTTLYGDSLDLIARVIPQNQTKCVFWLDAHYSGGDTAGSLSDCPLIRELSQILPLRQSTNSIILIDDSRALIGDYGWPILSEVINLLNQYNFSSIIIDDVLIASSTDHLKVFAESLKRSRTYALESLGGRMSLIMPLVKIIGFMAALSFKFKNHKFFDKGLTT